MLSKGMKLPDQDEVMRYVPWSRLRRDENENVIGVLPQAYAMRLDEEGLSVNWLEHFQGDRQERINQSVAVFRATIEVGKKSAYAVGVVGVVKQTALAQNRELKIVYCPEENNQAHSEIRKIPDDDLALLQSLADDAFTYLVQNSSIP
jgi:hypothetical protein